MDKKFLQNIRLHESLNINEKSIFDEVFRLGLPSDYFVEWMSCDIFGLEKLNDLRPLSTFREYVEKQVWKPEFKAFILKNSEANKIKQVDALAKQFNAELEGIQKGKDLDKLRDFYRRAMEIKNS